MRPWRVEDFSGTGGLLDLFAKEGKPFPGVHPQPPKGTVVKERKSFVGYNEVVVATDRWIETLPGSVEAIFYVDCDRVGGASKPNLLYPGDHGDGAGTARTCGEAEERAREMHSRFLKAYPWIRPRDFPLLALRPDDWRMPFAADRW